MGCTPKLAILTKILQGIHCTVIMRITSQLCQSQLASFNNPLES